MNSKLVLLLLSLLGISHGFTSNSEFLLGELAEHALSPNRPSKMDQTLALDKVTYVLVDTTLFLMQLGKTGLGFSGYIEDPMGPLFDFVFNTTKEECTNESCVENNIFMELRDTYISGLSTIKLKNDFQPSYLNLTLTVEDLSIGINGYRHTITNNLSNRTRIGEGAHLSLRNAIYGLKANYTFVPEVGIQLSNVDVTLDIGSENWHIDRRYTVLEDGSLVEEGEYDGDLAAEVMNTWNGEREGRPFEEAYEERAQLLINCGLSGGRSGESCSEVKEQLDKYKMQNFH